MKVKNSFYDVDNAEQLWLLDTAEYRTGEPDLGSRVNTYRQPESNTSLAGRKPTVTTKTGRTK